MKTYNEKLKRPEWRAFRDAYEERIKRDVFGGDDAKCMACGSSGPFQVHHLRYYRGWEPWEYEDEDLSLLCGPCHERIHAVADEFYSWLISLEPSTEYEARYLLDEFVKSRNPRVALAHCKNKVRTLNALNAAHPDRDYLDIGND